MTALEDLYLPFRPKRRTRATIARERGLEPLASRLFAQDPADRFDPERRRGGLCRPGDGRGLGRRRPSRGARHHGRVGERGSRDPRGDAPALRVARAVGGQGRAREDRGGGQVPRLLRLERRGCRRVLRTVCSLCSGATPRACCRCSLAPPEEEALALLESRFARGRGPAGGGASAAAHGRRANGRPSRWWSRCAKPLTMDIGGFSGRRWRPKHARRSRLGPTRRPSGSSPRTCASCCSLRRSGSG